MTDNFSQSGTKKHLEKVTVYMKNNGKTDGDWSLWTYGILFALTALVRHFACSESKPTVGEVGVGSVVAESRQETEPQVDREVPSTSCGCSTPPLDEITKPVSWDDVRENYRYVECAVAESPKYMQETLRLFERMHIYLYYNAKADIYRCQFLYSSPGRPCSIISQAAGGSTISSASISNETFASGKWKTYEYWFERQVNAMGY
jgi:hypothetical protein